MDSCYATSSLLSTTSEQNPLVWLMVRRRMSSRESTLPPPSRPGSPSIASTLEQPAQSSAQTRGNIAGLTGQHGDAMALVAEILPRAFLWGIGVALGVLVVESTFGTILVWLWLQILLP